MAGNDGYRSNTGTGDTSLNGTPAPIPKAYTDISDILKKYPEPTRVAMATALRAIGYKKVSKKGAITPDFIAAYAEVAAQKPQWDAIYPGLEFDQYLAKRVETEGTATAGGSGGPQSRTSYSRINESDAASLIQAVYADQVGRYATKAEIAKYTAKLRKAQARNPVSTSYSADGSVASTSGGLNEQQFLIDEIAGTDAAKRNRTLEGYSILLDVMGGGS